MTTIKVGTTIDVKRALIRKADPDMLEPSFDSIIRDALANVNGELQRKCREHNVLPDRIEVTVTAFAVDEIG